MCCRWYFAKIAFIGMSIRKNAAIQTVFVFVMDGANRIGTVLTVNAMKDGEVGMTIKEFADKYGIPYRLAYEATYRVKSYSTIRKDREYPEDGLFREAERIIKKKYDRHKNAFTQIVDAYNNLEDAGRREGFAVEMSKVRKYQAESDRHPAKGVRE